MGRRCVCLFVVYFSPLLARYECTLLLQSLRIACFLGKISLLSRTSFGCWSVTCMFLAKFGFFGPFSQVLSFSFVLVCTCCLLLLLFVFFCFVYILFRGLCFCYLSHMPLNNGYMICFYLFGLSTVAVGQGFFFPPLRCFYNCCLVLCFVFYGRVFFRIVHAMALSRQLGLENFASLVDFFFRFWCFSLCE